MQDTYSLRKTMVDSQLRTNKVTDPRVLAAMEDIPRELFVPLEYEGLAYIDEDIPLGEGRALLEPMIFARLVQQAGVKDTDVVLDIGCGSGYSAMVLGRLARTVVALESSEDLLRTANEAQERLDQYNVILEQGSLIEGWQAQAPYDAIFVNGAVEFIPDSLLAQLAEGGRLCTVIRPDRGPGKAVIMAETGGLISRRELFDANIPVLPEFRRKRGFTF